MEAAGHTAGREYFSVKARHVATEWERRQRKAKWEKNAMRSLGLLNTCEGYSREWRHVLRHQEDLEAAAAADG